MLKRISIVFIAIFIIACSRNQGSVQSIEDLQKRVSKINDLNTQLEGKRSELFGQIREFNATLPDSEQFDITSMDTLLGAPEKQLLRSMFDQEKDISYSALLKTIVAKNEEVIDLQEQINDLREQLQKPYTVQPGDTHYDVVLDYLISQHGLTEKEALKVAWKTSLIDEILPGYQIWLMYKDGVVGSFVTQGTANVAPMTYHVLAKQKLIERAAVAETVTTPPDSGGIHHQN